MGESPVNTLWWRSVTIVFCFRPRVLVACRLGAGREQEAEQSNAEQSKEEQNKAKPGHAKPSQVKRNKAKPSQAKRGDGWLLC